MGSRLGAVAFSTFSLWLEKGIKKVDKSSQNGYPGPKAVVREVAESDFWLCLLEFRECRRFSQKKWKTVDLHKTLAGIVQTHHRPSWKILFGLPLELFFQNWGCVRYAQWLPEAPKSPQITKKHILEKDSGPPLAFEARFWSGFGIKKELKSLKVLQNGAKKDPK